MATNVGNPVALDGNGTEAGVASKVKKAASTVMGSVIDSLESEYAILETGIDFVLEAGEVMPVVEHLAALLIKFKNKAKELAATVQDAHLKLRWAERVLRDLRFLPMPGEDTEGLEGAKRECLRDAMEAVQQLVEDAMSITNAGAGAASCMSCMSCCSTAAAAHFNKETFDEAKDNVAKALKDLELILAMDTNDVVHRLEDMATASAASHQKDMEKMFSMLQTLSSSSSTRATAEVPSSGAAPPSLNVISSGGGGSVVQPAAQKQAQEHLDEAVLLLRESQQKQQEQATASGGGGSSSSSSAAAAADLSLNAASAGEAALDTLPAGAKVAPELYIVGAVGYQGGGRFAQAAAKYALAVEVSADAPAGGGAAGAAAADFPPSASDGSNAEKKKKSASAESAEEGLRDVIKTMVDATVTKAEGGGGGGSLGVGAAKDVKAAIVSVLESEGLQSDELAAIIDRTAEEVLQERARAQEPPHMKVRFGRDIRESGGCVWVPDTTTQ